MIDRDAEPGLSSEERMVLWAWADPTVPDDFADRVMRAVHHDDRDDGDRSPSIELPIPRPSRLRTPAVAAVFALAAAMLLVWLVTSKQSYARAPGGEPVTSVTLSSLDRAALHESASRACLPCHGSLHAGAEIGALRAFDVDQPRWWELLTDEQYAALRIRLTGEPQPGRGIAAFMHE